MLEERAAGVVEREDQEDLDLTASFRTRALEVLLLLAVVGDGVEEVDKERKVVLAGFLTL